MVLALVPAVHARVAPAAPVDPAVRAPVVPVVHAPADPAHVRVAPVVRRWVVHGPVALVVRAQAAAPVVREAPVARAPAVPVAIVRMANVVHRARSRVPVDAGTWTSCSRSS